MPATGIITAREYESSGHSMLDDTTNQRIVWFTLVLAGLFLLDILTTQLILWMGGAELNPLMAGVVMNPALHLIVKSVILLIVLPVSLVAESRVQGSSVMLYCAIISMYLFIVVNNVFVILPHISL